MSDKPKHISEPLKWVDKYSDVLFRFAMVRVNNHNQAEDLVQDTFFSAIKKLKEFRGESSEKTWLYTILRNKIIDYYRSAEKKMSTRMVDIEDDAGASRYFYHEGKNEGDWVKEQQPGRFHEAADSQLERDELMSIILACMDKLPGTWSSVFRMKNIEELNTKEICKELGITSSNLWVIIHRAKLQLRECMEKNWMNERGEG